MIQGDLNALEGTECAVYVLPTSAIAASKDIVGRAPFAESN